MQSPYSRFLPSSDDWIRLCVIMPEMNPNLWAPWRSEYIRSLGDEADGEDCFLCGYAVDEARDSEYRVICRSTVVMAVMNRYPYTNGHLMLAPLRHVGTLNELSDKELGAVSILIRDSIKMLAIAVSAQGYNVGLNLGRCAGAGLPGHVHWHVVPRWNGDTNFMTTVGSARVIAESLDEVYSRLRTAAAELGLV
ncbi:MAG: HIT domain-containing protein [Planctomycetota bacterium]|nr:HIT domain-containing protein [Planctomycetota bacterium]